MNSINVDLHGYCSKLVNLYNHTHTDVDHFQAKLCKFYTFFYFTRTNMNALTLNRYKCPIIVRKKNVRKLSYFYFFTKKMLFLFS